MFARARAALAEDTDLTRFASAVERGFQPFEETGLIEKLEHLPEDGSQIWIKVYPVGAPERCGASGGQECPHRGSDGRLQGGV